MKRILIIEDQEDLRRLLARMLTLEGFETITAENGMTGIALTRERQPDLVFCDLRMPDLDGYEVLSALRADQVTANIPLIFVTASANQSARQLGLERGAAAYLTKPFKRDEILEVLRRCLPDPE
ncbi:MAG: response regulator [Burkholderiales bacterium]|nr:response regulator [Burkholderiales bacterium]